jgi:ribosomal protein L12E/L44/L45/RPP1/RPP2
MYGVFAFKFFFCRCSICSARRAAVRWPWTPLPGSEAAAETTAPRSPKPEEEEEEEEEEEATARMLRF